MSVNTKCIAAPVQIVYIVTTGAAKLVARDSPVQKAGHIFRHILATL